ncbi:hypothetical protein OHA02_52350 [Streptomyces phaeochromogenes]|nr:hypothetical protein [Streptomyces phaeochromogenes]
MDWTRHTAVAAAVVAAAGLAVTAWGTWKSAQVADDQLARSKEAQAAMITLWAEGDVLVISNRSADPAVTAIQIKSKPSNKVREWAHLSAGDGINRYYAMLGQLPPCTRLELTADVRKKLLGTDRLRIIVGLSIADARGSWWHRQMDGELRNDTHVLAYLDPIPTNRGIVFKTIEGCGGA